MKDVNWTPGEVPMGSPATVLPDPEGFIERMVDLEDRAMDLAADLKEIRIMTRVHTAHHMS